MPDISELLEAAREFQHQLTALKNSIPEIQWYHHPSLSGIAHLAETLTGRRRYLLSLIGAGPVLDIGCGDGDVAFFLESLGSKVWAIDFGPTNYNHLEGAAALKTALGSAVEISDLDLDAQFKFPADERYTAAFLLGVLYHLKNPFYVLETLSKHVGYCILSTRIARWTPDRKVSLDGLSVAYLLKKGEASSDPTNFWIFSEPGLRELCDRTNWDICDFATFGAAASDPVNPNADERAFCLLKSRMVAAIDPGADLVTGCYDPEPGGWRWTQQQFSIAFPNPALRVPGRLRIRFWVHQLLLDTFGSLTLSCRAGSFDLPPQKFAASGIQAYEIEVPAAALAEERVTFTFELDRALPPSPTDARELGVAVVSVDFS